MFLQIAATQDGGFLDELMKSNLAWSCTSVLKLARMFPITSPARWPSATIRLNASLALSRLGDERSRNRRPASAVVTIAVRGCRTSCEIDAATASPVIRRACRSRRWLNTASSSPPYNAVISYSRTTNTDARSETRLVMRTAYQPVLNRAGKG